MSARYVWPFTTVRPVSRTVTVQSIASVVDDCAVCTCTAPRKVRVVTPTIVPGTLFVHMSRMYAVTAGATVPPLTVTLPLRRSAVLAAAAHLRSEERRVGKECRCRWTSDQ